MSEGEESYICTRCQVAAYPLSARHSTEMVGSAPFLASLTVGLPSSSGSMSILVSTPSALIFCRGVHLSSCTMMMGVSMYVWTGRLSLSHRSCSVQKAFAVSLRTFLKTFDYDIDTFDGSRSHFHHLSNLLTLDLSHREAFDRFAVYLEATVSCTAS